MIAAIRNLTDEQKVELLELLSPRRTRRGLTGDEAERAIVEHLRHVLGFSKSKIDLAQGFRRRMIEVTQEFGGPAGPQHYDLSSDEEIALTLLKAVITRAQELAQLADEADKDPQAAAPDFEQFTVTFKTMSQADRADWLHYAALAASEADLGKADEEAARKAEELKASHERTAARLVQDVVVAGTIALDLAKARAKSGAAATAAAAASGTSKAAVLTTLAGPFGIVAGGAFLYALRKQRQQEKKAGRAEERPVQARRERLSPVVQAVVTTCAYLLAHPSPSP